MIISPDDLVRRNAAFAATGAFAGLPFPTSDTLQVLGCVDSRVDPSDVLGLELGDGVVMRNIGGRITPAALREWALLGRLGQGRPPGGHLVILHHTDCGIRRLADYPEQLAAFFESRPTSWRARRSATRTRRSESTPPSPGILCRRAGPCPAWSTTSAPGSSRSSTRPLRRKSPRRSEQAKCSPWSHWVVRGRGRIADLRFQEALPIQTGPPLTI